MINLQTQETIYEGGERDCGCIMTRCRIVIEYDIYVLSSCQVMIKLVTKLNEGNGNITIARLYNGMYILTPEIYIYFGFDTLKTQHYNIYAMKSVTSEIVIYIFII